MNRKRRLERLPRLVHLSLLSHDVGELAQREAFGVRIAALAEGCNGGLEQLLAVPHASALLERRGPDEVGGVARRRIDPGDAEHLARELDAKRERPLELEHAPRGPARCKRNADIGRARLRADTR